jgi:hypothetical protein
MTHVKVTLLPSWIDPFDVWVIVGNVVGASKNQRKYIPSIFKHYFHNEKSNKY